MILKSNLIGTDQMVKERLRAYRDVGVTTLHASIRRRTRVRDGIPALSLDDRIEGLGRLMDLVKEVNQE